MKITPIAIVTSTLLLGWPVLAPANPTWNNTGTDWNTSSDWTGGVPATGNANGSIAVFSTNAVTQPNISASTTTEAIVLRAAGYDITASPSATLTMVGNYNSGDGNGDYAIAFQNVTGTDTISAPIILAANNGTYENLATSVSGETLVLQGTIGSTGADVIRYDAIASGSVIEVTGANTFTNTIQVGGSGVVEVNTIGNTGSASALGENGTINLSTDLNYIGSGETSSKTINLLGSSTIDTTGSTGALVISGGVTASGSYVLTLTGNTTGNQVGAIANGTGNLATTVVKTGSGSWTLTGASTYTGSTTVSGGSLFLNNTSGSGAGTGSLTVAAGATLGGTGSYGTSTSKGAGFSIAGTGTATASRANVLVGMGSASDTNTTQSLTMIAASTATITNANLTFNLNSAVAGQGTEMNAGGTGISFGAGMESTTLTLNLVGANAVRPDSFYVLIAGSTTGGVDQYSGLSLGTGTGSLATGLLTPISNSGNGGTGNVTLALTGLANTWYGANSELFLYQNSTTGADDIEVEVVPEPGAWALMLGGLAMLIFWQRRKRRAA